MTRIQTGNRPIARWMPFLLVALIVVLICWSEITMTTFAAPNDATYTDIYNKLQNYASLDQAERSQVYDEAYAYIDNEWGICAVAFHFDAIASGAVPGLNIDEISTGFLQTLKEGESPTQAGTVFNAIVSGAEKVYDAMKVIGVMLVLIYFVIEIVEKAKAENVTGDIIARKFIALAIAVLFIMFGFDIFRYIMVFSERMIDAVRQNMQVGTGSVLAQLFAKWVTNAYKNWFSATIDAFGGFITSFSFALTQIVCIAVILAIMFARLLEIFVRLSFAPVGVANMFDSGRSNFGVTYIKKFAAACLQGAIMMAILLAMGFIRGSLSTGVTSASNAIMDFLGAALIPIGAAAAMAKSKTYAMDIIGV